MEKKSTGHFSSPLGLWGPLWVSPLHCWDEIRSQQAILPKNLHLLIILIIRINENWRGTNFLSFGDLCPPLCPEINISWTLLHYYIVLHYHYKYYAFLLPLEILQSPKFVLKLIFFKTLWNIWKYYTFSCLAIWSIKGRAGMFGLYNSSARLH